MTLLSAAFDCPFCQTVNDELDEEQIGNTVDCVGCGRRLRVRREGGTIACDNCNISHECPHCVASLTVRKLCAPDRCNWKSTLCADIEKCSACFDIRKIALPIRTPLP